jgi:WD40 repeat protein
MATTDTNGRVALRDATHGWGIARFLNYHGRAQAAAFAPGGHLLAIGGTTSDIILCDPRFKDAGHPLGMPIRQVGTLAFSPNGGILAATSSLHDEIVLWDLAGGRERMRLRGHASVVSSLAFAPDERWLAKASAVSSLTFSPDGRWLASGGRVDGMVIVWDLATGRPQQKLSGSPGPIMSLSSSPDGTRLASVNCYESCVRLWDSKAGRLDRLIAAHSSAPNAVAFAPDGRMLAIAGSDGGVGLWEVETGRQLARFGEEAVPLRSLAFSPDGKHLAVTGYDNDIRLWQVSDLPQAEPRP